MSLTWRFVHILHANYSTANLFYQSLYDSWLNSETSFLYIYICFFGFVWIYFLLINVLMTFGAFGFTFTFTFFFFSFTALFVVSSLALWTGSLERSKISQKVPKMTFQTLFLFRIKLKKILWREEKTWVFPCWAPSSKHFLQLRESRADVLLPPGTIANIESDNEDVNNLNNCLLKQELQHWTWHQCTIG